MREHAERSWRGAWGFLILVKDFYLYSRSSRTPLKVLSQGDGLEFRGCLAGSVGRLSGS